MDGSSFDFSQNVAVKSLDAVPEDFRSLYGEDKEAGGFKLKSEDGSVKGAVAAIVGLQRALKAARQDAKAKADLTPLSEFGKTPEEIAAGVRVKIEELSSKIDGTGKAKLDLEKIKADFAAAHVKESRAKDEALGNLTTQLKTILVDNAIRAALGDKSVNPNLALPFVKEKLQVVQEDGKFQVFVVDQDGSRRFSGVTANPMTIDELVREMRGSTEYAPLFKSDTPKGSGAPPGGSATQPFGSTQKLKPLDKIRLGIEARQKAGSWK